MPGGNFEAAFGSYIGLLYRVTLIGIALLVNFLVYVKGRRGSNLDDVRRLFCR